MPLPRRRDSRWHSRMVAYGRQAWTLRRRVLRPEDGAGPGLPAGDSTHARPPD